MHRIDVLFVNGSSVFFGGEERGGCCNRYCRKSTIEVCECLPMLVGFHRIESIRIQFNFNFNVIRIQSDKARALWSLNGYSTERASCQMAAPFPRPAQKVLSEPRISVAQLHCLAAGRARIPNSLLLVKMIPVIEPSIYVTNGLDCYDYE